MNGATSVGAGPWPITRRRTGRAHQRKMTDCHAGRLLLCEAGAQHSVPAQSHCSTQLVRATGSGGQGRLSGLGARGWSPPWSVGREGQFAEAGPKKLGRRAHDAAPQRRAC